MLVNPSFKNCITRIIHYNITAAEKVKQQKVKIEQNFPVLLAIFPKMRVKKARKLTKTEENTEKTMLILRKKRNLMRLKIVYFLDICLFYIRIQSH